MQHLNKENYHQSMRGYFAGELYNHMVDDDDVWVLTGDLGFLMLDKIRDDFPDRFVNTGASEQTLLDISVGLAMEDKKPFAYSITPFLLWRGSETIRNYINHENIPVRLVGSGRDDDYKHDGFSHHAFDAPKLLEQFENIKAFWPEEKEEIPDTVDLMIKLNRPVFISLKR